MLTGIGLRNFKAFGDEMQEAPLSKITLIYGPNSGGKSSLIQALLLLKQSIPNAYRELSASVLTIRGLVDLGSYQALVHKHESERQLDINLEIQNLIANSGIRMTFSDIARRGTLSAIRSTISLNDNKRIYESQMDFYPASDEQQFSHWISRSSIPGVYSDSKPYSQRQGIHFLPTPEMLNMVRFWARPITRDMASDLVPLQKMLIDRVTPMNAEFEGRFGGMAIEDSEHTEGKVPEWAEQLSKALVQSEMDSTEEQVLGSAFYVTGDHERHLRMLNYLGPLRSPPKRMYELSNLQDLNAGVTGIRGEHSANVLYRNPSVKKSVNYWFDGNDNEYRFEIPYELDVIKLGDASLAGEHITIALTDKRTDTQVTLADVGYGINQILPVIIEGIASQEGAILCVEQPEIHLHPRLQANIADLMIDTIADEPGKRKQWIVETHSELLILRLQRRIREGKIKPDDISVLYVDPSEDNGVEGSAIIELRLGEDSYFKDHWPHGFFDDALKEEMEPVYEQINSQENVDVLDEQFAE